MRSRPLDLDDILMTGPYSYAPLKDYWCGQRDRGNRPAEPDAHGGNGIASQAGRQRVAAVLGLSWHKIKSGVISFFTSCLICIYMILLHLN
jgi:hypothetical protein